MCPKLEDIRMDHIVDYTKNYVTFATARENSNNHLKIFLVNDSGSVYIREGRVSGWKELFGATAEQINRCIEEARKYVPVYRVNSAYAN
jgi:thiamine phosphate synthase YjbQ (UPF0047 family)